MLGKKGIFSEEIKR